MPSNSTALTKFQFTLSCYQVKPMVWLGGGGGGKRGLLPLVPWCVLDTKLGVFYSRSFAESCNSHRTDSWGKWQDYTLKICNTANNYTPRVFTLFTCFFQAFDTINREDKLTNNADQYTHQCWRSTVMESLLHVGQNCWNIWQRIPSLTWYHYYSTGRKIWNDLSDLTIIRF